MTDPAGRLPPSPRQVLRPLPSNSAASSFPSLRSLPPRAYEPVRPSYPPRHDGPDPTAQHRYPPAGHFYPSQQQSYYGPSSLGAGALGASSSGAQVDAFLASSSPSSAAAPAPAALPNPLPSPLSLYLSSSSSAPISGYASPSANPVAAAPPSSYPNSSHYYYQQPPYSATGSSTGGTHRTAAYTPPMNDDAGASHYDQRTVRHTAGDASAPPSAAASPAATPPASLQCTSSYLSADEDDGGRKATAGGGGKSSALASENVADGSGSGASKATGKAHSKKKAGGDGGAGDDGVGGIGGTAGGGAGGAGGGGGRVAKACQPCSSKKRRCDGGQPQCSVCLVLGTPCTYSTSSLKRGPPKGFRAGPRESARARLVRNLETLLRDLVNTMGEEDTTREIVRVCVERGLKVALVGPSAASAGSGGGEARKDGVKRDGGKIERTPGAVKGEEETDDDGGGEGGRSVRAKRGRSPNGPNSPIASSPEAGKGVTRKGGKRARHDTHARLTSPDARSCSDDENGRSSRPAAAGRRNSTGSGTDGANDTGSDDEDGDFLGVNARGDLSHRGPSSGIQLLHRHPPSLGRSPLGQDEGGYESPEAAPTSGTGPSTAAGVSVFASAAEASSEAKRRQAGFATHTPVPLPMAQRSRSSRYGRSDERSHGADSHSTGERSAAASPGPGTGPPSESRGRSTSASSHVAGSYAYHHHYHHQTGPNSGAAAPPYYYHKNHLDSVSSPQPRSPYSYTHPSVVGPSASPQATGANSASQRPSSAAGNAQHGHQQQPQPLSRDALQTHQIKEEDEEDEERRFEEMLTEPDPEPSPQESARLFRMYWEAVHPYWPLLFKPVLDRLPPDQLPSRLAPCLLYSIYAIAACVVDSSLEEDANVASRGGAGPKLPFFPPPPPGRRRHLPSEKASTGPSTMGIEESKDDETAASTAAAVVGSSSVGAGAPDDDDEWGLSPREAELKATAERYHRCAEKYLFKTRLRSDVSTIQSLFLLSLYCHGTGEVSQAWMYSGMACSMAFDLGLHRWPIHRMSLLYHSVERETRVRLVWSAYILDKVLAAEMGRPVMMRAKDCDAPLLSETEADEYELWTGHTELPPMPQTPYTPVGSIAGGAASGHSHRHAPPPASPTGRLHAASCFNQGVLLFQIVERILTQVHSFRRRAFLRKHGGHRKILHELDADLTAWLDRLPKHLWLNLQEKTDVALPSFFCLHAWYHTAVLLLHRSFIPQDPGVPLSELKANESFKKCAAAANTICDMLEICHTQHKVDRISGDLAYCLFTAAVMHVFIARLPSKELATDARRRFSLCRQWLKALSRAWPAASAHKQLLDGFADVGDKEISEDVLSGGSDDVKVSGRRPSLAAPRKSDGSQRTPTAPSFGAPSTASSFVAPTTRTSTWTVSSARSDPPPQPVLDSAGRAKETGNETASMASGLDHASSAISSSAQGPEGASLASWAGNDATSSAASSTALLGGGPATIPSSDSASTAMPPPSSTAYAFPAPSGRPRSSSLNPSPRSSPYVLQGSPLLSPKSTLPGGNLNNNNNNNNVGSSDPVPVESPSMPMFDLFDLEGVFWNETGGLGPPTGGVHQDYGIGFDRSQGHPAMGNTMPRPPSFPPSAAQMQAPPSFFPGTFTAAPMDAVNSSISPPSSDAIAPTSMTPWQQQQQPVSQPTFPSLATSVGLTNNHFPPTAGYGSLGGGDVQNNWNDVLSMLTLPDFA